MLGAITDPNPFLTLSVVLVAGVGAGLLAKRFHLPAVTGQILVGILIGPSVLEIFELKTIHDLEPIIDFALGLMAVDVGSHLQIKRLGIAKRRLTLLLLLEATLTPAIVFAGVFLIGTSWYMSLLLATIAISTAPATILAIVKETRSKGVFVKTLVAAVALNNLFCILGFEVAHTVARTTVTGGTDYGGVWLAPIRQLALSACLGCGVGLSLIAVTRKVVRPDRMTAISMIAILLTIGLAQHFDISVLLSCLFLGVLLANATPDKEEIGHDVFENFEYGDLCRSSSPLAGMELNFKYSRRRGRHPRAGRDVRGARFLGKTHSRRTVLHAACEHDATACGRLPGTWPCMPQAGLAVGLMLLVTEDAAPSPPCRRMRDVDPRDRAHGRHAQRGSRPDHARARRSRVRATWASDRARFIDFIHEEHIITRAQGPERRRRRSSGSSTCSCATNDLQADRPEAILA